MMVGQRMWGWEEVTLQPYIQEENRCGEVDGDEEGKGVASDDRSMD